MRTLTRLVAVLTWVVLLPAAASAQGSMVGVVKDTSGAVLPGVTVEAASPALIEKVRSVVTDGTGQYTIASLVPGTYSLTFTLPGFSTVKREGIELTGTFTAKVDAELRVGTVAETITVTGETPVVDVQSTTRERVMDRQIIDTIPAGRTAYNLGVLVPGVTLGGTNVVQDVGGSGGTPVGGQPGTGASLAIHGSSDQIILQSGVPATDFVSGSVNPMGTNPTATQEIVFDTSAVSAELATGGIRVNVIPRDGGNTFNGTLFGAFTNDTLQANNFDAHLNSLGVSSSDHIKRIWDFNPGFGGPVQKDRLWFYLAARRNEVDNYATGAFYNRNANNPNAWTYLPDPSRPLSNDSTNNDGQLRFTWQATAKNKVGFTWHEQVNCYCQGGLGPSVALEASLHKNYPVNRSLQVDWASPVTNRLLLEASVLSMFGRTNWDPWPQLNPAMIAVTEQSSGLTYRSGDNGNLQQYHTRPQWTLNMAGAASYITGTHNVKVGFNHTHGNANDWMYSLQPVTYRFNNGVPNQITESARPYSARTDVNHNLGLFAQDKWTMRRLTFSYGLRFDYYANGWPAQHLGPTVLLPTRDFSFPAASNLAWRDITPKSGLSYDVFGNGKTALKISLNKYVSGISLSPGPGFGIAPNPTINIVQSTTRSWNDSTFGPGDPRTGNYIPDCDLLNIAISGECGALANPNLGQPTPLAIYDPKVMTGWGKRGYNWEFSAGVQREILPRTSVDVSYFRRWFGNFQVTNNLAVSPSDYTSYTIAAPVDARLPGGGGYAITGYDLNPNKFGVPAQNFVTNSDTYGKQYQHWNGVDVTVNARPRAGMLVQGGLSTGRTVTDTCDLLAKLGPEVLFGALALGVANAATAWMPPQYCHQQGNFLTQVKLLGSYTIPRVDAVISATLQSLPGPQLLANYNAPNALVAPALGRSLSGSAANSTIELLAPGTLTGDRLNQVDLRVGKIFRYAKTRTSLNVDLYNAFNSNAVLNENTNFGAYRRPNNILQARFVKFTLQFDF
jgi:hypothetical protein